MGDDDPAVTTLPPSDAGHDDTALAPSSARREDRRSGTRLASGTVVDGDYRVERLLGVAGMGVVYLARDLRLDRDVALKVHNSVGRHAALRLAREATAMARVTHPNVVGVHRVGELDGAVFVAMEYVAGGTLRTWVPDRSMREVVAAYAAAGDRLAAAHAAGLVHRDFKPDNVLVGTDDRPRVTDFGLAVSPARGWARPRTWRPSSGTAARSIPAAISSRTASRYGRRCTASDRSAALSSSSCARRCASRRGRSSAGACHDTSTPRSVAGSRPTSTRDSRRWRRWSPRSVTIPPRAVAGGSRRPSWVRSRRWRWSRP